MLQAKFGFISGQLLCFSDDVRTRGKGLLLLKTQSHYLRNCLTGGGFPIVQEGNFSYSGADLGVWPLLKKRAGTHEAGRLCMTEEDERQESRMALTCYRCLVTHMSKLGSFSSPAQPRSVHNDWLTPFSTPPPTPQGTGGSLLAILCFATPPAPGSLSLRKNNNTCFCS